MSGRLLEKYTGRPNQAFNELEDVSESDGTEDLGAFGWLRGPRERAIMLELRRKGGDIVAISYSYIDKVQFNPSEGIMLHLGKQTISIKGRNLNGEVRSQVRLFQGITRHRVPWIVEADHAAALQAPRNAVIVESIVW